MLADNHFGVGFLRGLNSVAEVFAPYYEEDDRSQIERTRSHWINVGEYLRRALANMLSSLPDDFTARPPSDSHGPPRPITSIISAHWSGPLPPPGELEKINQIIPGSAERLLCMAEKDQCIAEQAQTYRMRDSKRGQYLGWSLGMGAILTPAIVSLCHVPWQVCVALVGIPVMGSVQALILGRKEKFGRRPIRWF